MTEAPHLQVCGRLCDTGEVMTLALRNGRIAGSRRGAEGANLGGPEWWLAPGFLDLQLNGYAGSDFNLGYWGGGKGDQQDLQPIFDRAAQAGTALLCPTITTNSADAILANLTNLACTLETDPPMARRVPGIHLEGPYLSPEDGPRGAHPREHVRAPDWDEFQRFQDAAKGRIKLCTLAPELEGALPFIEKLAASGVAVALGHTDASAEVIADAVQAGARVSTHLGNGAHDQIQRHHNPIWEQMANDNLYATIIADGQHLPPAILRCLARAKGPERLALVSDAVSLGGLPPGLYSEGRHEVLPSGRVVLAGTPYLAGAGHLLDMGIAHALRLTDLSLAQAVRCASVIPARILGLEGHKGHLQTGYDADLTLFRVPDAGPLEIAATVCAGKVVYKA